MMAIAHHKQFSLNDYHRLIESGIFREDERIELIRGEILEMAAKGTRHRVCCTRLLRSLSPLLHGKAILQCQDPIILSSNSEPEPDFAILRYREDDYLAHHPTPDDIYFVIEIADSSLEYDRAVKLPLYAEAKISHYWLFNLREQHLEVYSQPYQTMAKQFDYRQRLIFLADQQVTLPNFAEIYLDLSSIFPI